VVAANIDTVFICMSLTRDLNPRRLERYLAVAWDSGATPVVVLTKSDLCHDVDSMLARIGDVTAGADIIVTSSVTEAGCDSIPAYVRTGRTVAFIGSSGVGKSTLINTLLGGDFLATDEVRKDGKGRHCTTRRDLIAVPAGGAVIDTPGMRELGVESVDLARAFSDIDRLAEGCRFSDCRHGTEPGCLVRETIASGELSEERLASYLKLKKEARYDGLNSRQIEREKMTEMYSGFDGAKNAREYVKSKNRKR
jgi:ribosome biogenesis GTPase